MISKWYPYREDPQFGVFIQKHARAIAKKNNIAVLFIHSSENATENFETDISTEDGVHEIIIRFKKNKSYSGKLINFFRYLIALSKGISCLKRTAPKPDIIHSYILLRPGIIGWYLSFTKKIPHVISEQWSGFITGKFLTSNRLRRSLTLFIVKKAAAVTSVSNFLLLRMKECGLTNNNFFVTPNIIEKHPVVSDRSGNQLVNVLLVADLVDEIKNISGVIKMIGALHVEVPFQLQIIGAGKDELKLKELASSFNLLNRVVFFEGLKSNREVYTYLDRSDFLIMNSRYETFSLICAEAMSCGKPVLATKCGGPNEFVNDFTGVLIETDDPIALRDNFVFMLKNYKTFNPDKMIEYSRMLFSGEEVSEKFQQVYITVTENSN